MLVTAIRCKKCNDIIWSRARHDFHWCSCKSVAIDGGRDYVKVCGEPENIKVLNSYEINVSEKEAYEDWNKQIDKLGTIRKVG